MAVEMCDVSDEAVHQVLVFLDHLGRSQNQIATGLKALRCGQQGVLLRSQFQFFRVDGHFRMKCVLL